VIAARSGGHAFAFYTAMMVLQLVWVLLVMPETKGVSLDNPAALGDPHSTTIHCGIRN